MKVKNTSVWWTVFLVLISGIFVIATLYTINFYFSVRGATEIIIGGEAVVQQLEQQDPDLAFLLRILAISIAITMNVFEVVGVLGDIYWQELKGTLDIFGGREDKWVRPSLRVFYVTIFALDVATNLLGLPRPTGAVHATALFLTAVFLSTIEYPFLWWFLPFLALWKKKEPRGKKKEPRGTETDAADDYPDGYEDIPGFPPDLSRSECFICGKPGLPGYNFCARHAPRALPLAPTASR